MSLHASFIPIFSHFLLDNGIIKTGTFYGREAIRFENVNQVPETVILADLSRGIPPDARAGGTPPHWMVRLKGSTVVCAREL
jgi:hypothetical protein